MVKRAPFLATPVWAVLAAIIVVLQRLDSGAVVTSRTSSNRERPRSQTFLVEVYTAARAVATAAEAAIWEATSRQPSAKGAEETNSPPELLSAIFIPGDETAFFLVRARDEVEVRVLLGRARVRFDRIVPADATSLSGASLERASTATGEADG